MVESVNAVTNKKIVDLANLLPETKKQNSYLPILFERFVTVLLDAYVYPHLNIYMTRTLASDKQKITSNDLNEALSSLTANPNSQTLNFQSRQTLSCEIRSLSKIVIFLITP